MGTLSVSDLRGITRQRFLNVLLPVNDFLSKCISQPPPITCSPQTKLSEIVQQCLDLHVHRVWAVNEKKQPQRAVSYTDVIRKFMDV